MTSAVFLVDALPGAVPGAEIVLDGPEGRHAVVVRRIGTGEELILADGHGSGVRGVVVAVGKAALTVRIDEVLHAPEPVRRFVAVQALAKGDRGESAVEMLTEVGIQEVVPWQASRSIVRWSGDRGDKGLARWRSTAREAAKQSRRLHIPHIGDPIGLRQLLARVSTADLVLVLHEEATVPIGEVALPATGEVLVVIGPEGGISPDELTALIEAGGRPVSLGDGVLRTSTAGVVALAALRLRPGPTA